eukprot:6579841-Alexandrium_andersonii.AAC.1
MAPQPPWVHKRAAAPLAHPDLAESVSALAGLGYFLHHPHPSMVQGRHDARLRPRIVPAVPPQGPGSSIVPRVSIILNLAAFQHLGCRT